jgi:hypothetical protein
MLEKLQSLCIGRHFGYNNFIIQMIDCVKPGEDEAIFIVEGIWQNRLATFTQHGNINVRDELMRKTRFYGGRDKIFYLSMLKMLSYFENKI